MPGNHGLQKDLRPNSRLLPCDESAANTFTQEEVALQLDVLNNEIFVVLAVDLNPSAPEMIGGLNTETQSAVTATSQTAMATLEATNTISVASLSIRADATMAVGFTRAAEESYWQLRLCFFDSN